MIAELRCAVRWLLPVIHEAHGGHKALEQCGQDACRSGLVARTSWSEDTLRQALVKMHHKAVHLGLPSEARELLNEALGACREATVVWWGVQLRVARERKAA